VRAKIYISVLNPSDSGIRTGSDAIYPQGCESYPSTFEPKHLLLLYEGADKSLARATSRRILFDGENICFDASLVIYIYIYIYI